MTVEEVATLATTYGWSYESLMAMSGAERRLWLAAGDRVADARAGRPATTGTDATRGPGGGPATPPGVSTAPAAPGSAWTAVGPLATEEERRARLLQLHEELNHRERR